MTTDPEYLLADEKQVCKHYKTDPVIFFMTGNSGYLVIEYIIGGTQEKGGISKSISQWTVIIPRVGCQGKVPNLEPIDLFLEPRYK